MVQTRLCLLQTSAELSAAATGGGFPLRWRGLGNLNPNVAYLCRGKTRKSASDAAAHKLGQVEAYLTVPELLFLRQPQMECYRASKAVFTAVAM
jgi:hypothetical protein